MKKAITCDKCNGRGYFTYEQSGADYAGVTVLRCEVCQGKGTVEVPVTNADHIRSMTDEELAEFMAECNAYGEGAIASQWMPWLKQPYKEES